MLDYLGKTEIPVVIETTGYIRTLRTRKPSDVDNKDVFHTWLFFRKTQEGHVSITIELAFRSDFLIGLYKDDVLEWSSLAMYAMQMDSDIACYAATHCESLLREGNLSEDYRTYPDEEDPRKPSVATSGDLAGRVTSRIFECVWGACFPMLGDRPDPVTGSLKATQAILNLLSGGQENFPRVDLIVNQNTAEREFRRLQGGETFEDGTRVKLDATRCMEVATQHELVKMWLGLKE